MELSVRLTLTCCLTFVLICKWLDSDDGATLSNILDNPVIV